MKTTRIVFFASTALGLACALTQCSSSSAPPPGGGGGGVGGGGGTGAGGGGGGVVGYDGAGLDNYAPPTDSPSGSSDGSFGGLTVIEEPDEPCAASGGTTATLYAVDAGAPPLQKLVVVGSGRAAGGQDLGGFVTFNADGTSPSSPVTLGNALFDFDSEGTTIGAAGSQGTSVLFQRYSAQGAAQGSNVTVASGLASIPRGVGIGSGDGQSLVVWAGGGGLHAVAVDASGNPGSKFDFAAGAYSTNINIVVTYAGSGSWAVAWTGDPVANSTTSSFAVANATSIVTGPVTITSATFTFQVVKVAKTPSGYGLLVTTNQAINANARDTVYVIPLDGSGNPTGVVHRYLGADIAWDLAAQGSDMGLVAIRQLDNDLADAGLTALDGTPLDQQPYLQQFRPLDGAGHPLGGWVCIGTDIPSTSTWVDMAIAADGTGYAVLSHSPSGNDQLTRFDNLGTGP